MSRQGTLQHHLFLKKEKLAHKKINLNVVDSLLHHVTHVETTKDTWDNLCVTFEKRHVGNRLQLCQEFYNPKMDKGTLMQVHINKLQMIIDC
jgi:hypothetical protein